MNKAHPESAIPLKESVSCHLIRKWCLVTVCLWLLLIMAGVLALATGSSKLSISTLIQAAWAWLGFAKVENAAVTILFRIRLPRLILGFFVGGALSMAGVIFQGLFHNPLVEPYTLGISGGAALGVSLALLFGGQSWWGGYLQPLSGFLGALITIILVYGFARKGGLLRTNTMLLAGVMISFISSSAIMLLMALSPYLQRIHTLLFWIMGSLQESNLLLIGWVCGFITLAAVSVIFFYRELNILSLGKEEALHLGISVERAAGILFLLASLLTGLAVSISGMIGFVGLMIPHLMRMIIGHDHRFLLTSSFLAGGIFLILADTAARTLIAPIELPVGVITGLIGGTIFIIFLYRENV